MKRFKIAAIAALVGAGCYFGYNSLKPAHEFTSTEMENIEALADYEYQSSEIPCFSSSYRNNDASYVDCASCTRIAGWEGHGTEALCHTHL
jgi:hypothetical protein